jgi:hypothetical protein
MDQAARISGPRSADFAPSPAGAAVELPTCQVGAVHVLGAAWVRQPSEPSGMIEGLEPMAIEITMGIRLLASSEPTTLTTLLKKDLHQHPVRIAESSEQGDGPEP